MFVNIFLKKKDIFLCHFLKKRKRKTGLKIQKEKNILVLEEIMPKTKKKTISAWLAFKPFLKIARQKKVLLFFDKQNKIPDETEWSLDCSGQGECQPNVSPSDGDEKIEFVQEAKNKKAPD